MKFSHQYIISIPERILMLYRYNELSIVVLGMTKILLKKGHSSISFTNWRTNLSEHSLESLDNLQPLRWWPCCQYTGQRILICTQSFHCLTQCFSISFSIEVWVGFDSSFLL